MKNQSIETDSEMTKLITLADKDIKHTFITMCHMPKYEKRNHKYIKEIKIRCKRKLNGIFSGKKHNI